MQNGYFLCVDSGTTVIKACLIDQDLRIAGEAKRPVAVNNPFPGASETDMNLLWHSLCQITQELAQKCPAQWPQIKGVTITGQGDGLWAIDKEGQPVGPAFLWNDTRSKDMDFDAIPGMGEAVRRNNTNLVFAGSICALLTWLKANRPQDYGRIRAAFHCKDWLNFKLTGQIYTDCSDAATSVYDTVNIRYATDILDLCGIPEAINLLAPIVPSGSIIGEITGEAFRQTGIPQGVPVVQGSIDVSAVALGSDVDRPGRSTAIIGTTLSCQVVLDKQDMDLRQQTGLLVHHAVPRLFIRAMPTLSGSSTLDYVKGLFFPNVPYPDLEEGIRALPIGSDGLIYHPYICGERAPFKNPFATAGFFGLTQTHTPMHMLRSAFEGLACSFYDCYQVFKGNYDSIYLSGGASANPTLCQMFSDMIGLPCRQVRIRELGTLGMAKAAQVALGFKNRFEDFEEQNAFVFEPDMARHQKYLDVYALFRDMQDKVADFWNQRTTLL